MLTSFRDGLRNSKILKYVFVGIISVPFVFVGVASYVGGGADVDAATVNGDAIPTARFEQANYQQQQRMRQLFGGQLPAELINTRALREDVLEALINEQLMLQRSQADYYTASDLELAKAVQTDPNFQVDGQFDRDRYAQILSANRSSPLVYEETLRRQLVLQQLYQAISSSDFELDGERLRSAALSGQEREVSRARFSLGQLRDTLSVSDSEIEARYQSNRDDYMRPEQYKVAYIDVNADALRDGVSLDEDTIEGEYQRRIGEFGRAEAREASHILVAVDDIESGSEVDAAREKAEALLVRIRAGEDFSAIAASDSDDAGSADIGGSLGEFERGVMTPAFDDAVFSLDVGQISDVVQTDFGFHIIRLDRIAETTAAPLDEVRGEIEAGLRAQLASEAFADQRETLSAESFENPNSLDSAADLLGVEVQVSDWVSAELTDGLGAFPAVLEAIRSDDVFNQALNSEIIDLGPERSVVLRLEDVQATELKPLDEVRAQIEGELLDQAAATRADELVASVLAAVESGTPLEDAASELGAVFEPPVWVARQGGVVDGAVATDVFEASQPGSGGPVYLRSERGDGDPVVVALHAVRAGSLPASDAQQASAYALAFGNAAFRAVQQAMRADADVTINERVLDPDFVPYGADHGQGL
ncbi:MAG: SurA N-terminal domain-containing protein [Pseudomonadota bacterium]